MQFSDHKENYCCAEVSVDWNLHPTLNPDMVRNVIDMVQSTMRESGAHLFSGENPAGFIYNAFNRKKLPKVYETFAAIARSFPDILNGVDMHLWGLQGAYQKEVAITWQTNTTITPAEFQESVSRRDAALRQIPSLERYPA